MSPRLIALLRFYKTNQSFTGWRQIQMVLGHLYHADMPLESVIHHMVAAYEEARAEPRFRITSDAFNFERILFAPASDALAKGAPSEVTLSSEYQLDFVYNSLIGKIVAILTYGTNIGWCRDVLFTEESETDAS